MISMDKKYRTRQGSKVRIYAIDGDDEMPVHGAILTTQGWKVSSWARDGKWCPNMTDAVDLIEVRPRIKREVWVNVYDKPNFMGTYGSREMADANCARGRIACVKMTIDCEEGDGLTHE